MRIAMVGPFGFHPNKTMHSRALGLARALVRRGHDVQIFMPPWQTPAEADRTWTEDGVGVRYVPLRGGIPGITRRLVQEVLRWQPQIVHHFKPKAYSGLVARWLWQFHRRRLRLVTDSDDWEGWGGWNNLAPYSPAQRHFFARQEQWGMRHCHRLTVASRALQTLAWSLGVPPEQVVYLPNGSGIEKYAVSGNQLSAKQVLEKREELGAGQRPLLLLYSRLFEFDSARLVAVLRGVQTAVPDVAVLAVGAGLYDADSAQFRAQLAAADLQDRVIDAGWVETAVLPPLLRTADAAIYLMEDTLLNRTKCPVKLADLLMLGIPVVAEAVGQVPEYVVHGQTGLLHPTGDVAGLTAGLVRLLQNPKQRQRFGNQARAHYDANFTWNVLAERLERVYMP